MNSNVIKPRVGAPNEYADTHKKSILIAFLQLLPRRTFDNVPINDALNSVVKLKDFSEQAKRGRGKT